MALHKQANIIGAGIGGLATAIKLRNKGLHVRLFESSKKTGGKINEFYKDGFRFDMGPSLFTLPHLLDDLFQECGRDISHYFKYKALDESCQYFFEDGTHIKASTNTDAFASEVEEKTGEPASRVKTFLENSRFLYELTAHIFIFNNLHSPWKIFKKDFLKIVRHWRKVDTLQTMHQSLEKSFDDPRIVQLFDRYATYNGSNPYKAPATLNVIPHLEHNTGAYFPEKGMYSIAHSLTKLAGDMGVEIFTQKKVESVICGKKQTTAIKANGQTYHHDLLICDTDVKYFYKNILKEPLKKKHHNQEHSSSALIFYWGINRTFEQLHLHNILFSDHYKKEFESLFDQKSLFNDPTVYIFISSKEVAGDAPAGKENWFVMINAPGNTGQDWDKMIEETRHHIIKKINRMLNIDIQPYILFEEILDPPRIEERTSSTNGSLYGNSSNNRIAAFLRHPNFHPKYKNLYFTGGSVHPGGGIPLCLASANIVCDQLIRYDH